MTAPTTHRPRATEGARTDRFTRRFVIAFAVVAAAFLAWMLLSGRGG